jgi:hypothetical protein
VKNIKISKDELQQLLKEKSAIEIRTIDSMIDQLKGPKLIELLKGTPLSDYEIGYLSALKDLQNCITERLED